MSYGNVIRALKEFGVRGTFDKLWSLKTIKFGAVVGVDQMGNTYYENAIDYPQGQTRWVEYAGYPTFYDVDASTVPAEWHSWLHYTVKEPPTETAVGNAHSRTLTKSVEHSDAPYTKNLGGVVSAFTPNRSHQRPRGFGVGNGLDGAMGSGPDFQGPWTQPGNPMDPRFVHDKETPRWTLRDTEASIKAARDADLAGTGDVTGDEAAALLEQGQAATFAHSSSSLTPEEAAFAAEHAVDINDEDALTALESRVLMLEDIVAEYNLQDEPDLAHEGLVKARAELDQLRAEYSLRASIMAKLNA